MAQDLHSQRNVPPSTIGPSKQEQLVSPKETPVTSGMRLLDVPAPKAPVFTSVPATAFTNRLFQKFMKAYLENQNQAPSSAPIQIEFWVQPLKAQFPDLYYENSHLDCYHFCQQCKDHFKTARAKRPNRIFFATSFLHNVVAQQ